MKKKYFFLIGLIIVVCIAYLLAPGFPEFFTTYYNQRFYTFLDQLLHTVTNLFSFSLGDVFYAVIIVFVIYKIVMLIKKGLFRKLSFFLMIAIASFFGIFQLFWGFNNYKYSIAYQLELDRDYDMEDLKTLTNKLTMIVNHQHLLITGGSLQKVVIEKDLELFNKNAKLNYAKLPDHLKKILTTNKINNVKPSFYSALQSYTGFSGYFNPFTHENQVNIQIPTIGMPVTVAHEMAHQLGISSETEANFFGYQVLLQSENVKFKYAANLYALKYCLKQYRNENEETYQLLFNRLNVGVQQNILESELFWQSKRNISSYFFKHLYGRFLKINNQKDGIQSYNKFVGLLINYNKKYPHH
ncbi:Protein of unknown function [Paenimyroides aquimaris]|uniref:DUF3810 domain-containing protein n=1 Tax=Paenimyroides marinum TaxID=1159016 RepID=A0A1H6K589_9FLAO|nr:DUF3810 domain-containing protein [Paenimyroides aquimaris]SEH66951.1 Protein of unknown function [Paenimyroides aquimaris]